MAPCCWPGLFVHGLECIVAQARARLHPKGTLRLHPRAAQAIVCGGEAGYQAKTRRQAQLAWEGTLNECAGEAAVMGCGWAITMVLVVDGLQCNTRDGCLAIRMLIHAAACLITCTYVCPSLWARPEIVHVCELAQGQAASCTFRLCMALLLCLLHVSQGRAQGRGCLGPSPPAKALKGRLAQDSRMVLVRIAFALCHVL